MLNAFVVSNLSVACFASQTPGLCSAFPSRGSHKIVARLCCILLCSVIFCFACFASQTSGLGSAFPSAPVKPVTRFCYALVRNLFCLFCLTNAGFVQCYSLGSRKVRCTLVFNFALFSNFCFACFASHTSGLCCSAFPSAPVKSVTRFCYALVSVFCLTNTGFVQCYPLGSRKVCCTLLFNLFYSVILVLRALPHMQTSELCSAFPSAPVKSVTRFCYAFVRTLFCVFCLTNIRLEQCFPFGSPQVYTLLVFFILFSLLLLCVLRPASSGLCSDFSPPPLEFARFIFLLCIIQF